jgi:hypothetical protein
MNQATFNELRGRLEQLNQARFKRIFGTKHAQDLEAISSWEKIRAHAKTADDQRSVFLLLPDIVTEQPIPGLSFGKRSTEPKYQREKYEEVAKCAKVIIDFSTSTEFRRLLADQALDADEKARLPNQRGAENACQMYPRAGVSAGRMRAHLNWLHEACLGANPYKWYLSKQPLSKDAGLKTCIQLVAQLNRYLIKPQHTALATLANKNLAQEDIYITSDAICKAWNAHPWTNYEK